MRPLKISISGIRGVAGEDLTPAAVSRFACAYGRVAGGGKIAVATDARASRDMCFKAVCRGLSDSGCIPASAGILPTPTLQMIIPEIKASGGVCITASHNPPEWNGLKFYAADGILLDESAMRRVISMFEEAGDGPAVSSPPGEIEEISEKARAHHVKSVLAHLDAGLIRRGRFKAVVDSVNGAGGAVNSHFFRGLGCELIELNPEMTGRFNRPAEPIPENLEGLSSAVLEHKADIGFAQDPDADRLAIVLEDGSRPGEDYTLALAVKHILSKTPGAVVTNLSTTRALEDICGDFGVPLIRTRIGERNVVAGMQEAGAVIGGEGNGGVIFPAVHYGRDSLAGMGIILQAMAESRKPVSGLLEDIPRYFIIKEKVPAEAILPVEEIKNIGLFSGAKIDLADGVRAAWDDSWAHVRGSGTEPAVRIIVEAKDEQSARTLYGKVLSAVSV